MEMIRLRVGSDGSGFRGGGESIVETKNVDDRAAIRKIVKDMNLAWREGRFEELRSYFHPAAAIVIPWSGARCEGRDRCVQSYADFMKTAKITRYSETDAVVDVVGDTAVATFEWTVQWTVPSGPQQETGHDVLVLTRQAGKWLVVWRTQVSRPSKA
jgi:ketosteroid isomerase-like protein